MRGICKHCGQPIERGAYWVHIATQLVRCYRKSAQPRAEL